MKSQLLRLCALVALLSMGAGLMAPRGDVTGRPKNGGMSDSSTDMGSRRHPGVVRSPQRGRSPVAKKSCCSCWFPWFCSCSCASQAARSRSPRGGGLSRHTSHRNARRSTSAPKGSRGKPGSPARIMPGEARKSSSSRHSSGQVAGLLDNFVAPEMKRNGGKRSSGVETVTRTISDLEAEAIE